MLSTSYLFDFLPLKPFEKKSIYILSPFNTSFHLLSRSIAFYTFYGHLTMLKFVLQCLRVVYISQVTWM